MIRAKAGGFAFVGGFTLLAACAQVDDGAGRSLEVDVENVGETLGVQRAAPTVESTAPVEPRDPRGAVATSFGTTEAPAVEAEPAPGCMPRSPLSPMWVSELRADGLHSLEAVVRNRSGRAIETIVQVLIDFGRTRDKRAIVFDGRLEPGEERVARLELGQYAGQIADMPFSGLVSFVALTPGGQHLGHSEDTFFHPDGGALVLYDHETLLNKHNFGDYQRRVDPGLLEPGLQRLVDGSDVRHSDNDELEAELMPELPSTFGAERAPGVGR